MKEKKEPTSGSSRTVATRITILSSSFQGEMRIIDENKTTSTYPFRLRCVYLIYIVGGWVGKASAGGWVGRTTIIILNSRLKITKTPTYYFQNGRRQIPISDGRLDVLQFIYKTENTRVCFIVVVT